MYTDPTYKCLVADNDIQVMYVLRVRISFVLQHPFSVHLFPDPYHEDNKLNSSSKALMADSNKRLISSPCQSDSDIIYTVRCYLSLMKRHEFILFSEYIPCNLMYIYNQNQNPLEKKRLHLQLGQDDLSIRLLSCDLY